MNEANVIQIGVDAMVIATKLAAPILLTALAVGTLIGMIQSATQLQEPTLTFVPKFMAVGLVFLASGNWMLAQLVQYTRAMFAGIPGFLG